MLFLFISRLLNGLNNLLTTLHDRTPTDMAFPRLNAGVPSGLCRVFGVIADGQLPGCRVVRRLVGWCSNPPVSLQKRRCFLIKRRRRLWIVVSVASRVCPRINGGDQRCGLTILRMRAPGMTLFPDAISAWTALPRTQIIPIVSASLPAPHRCALQCCCLTWWWAPSYLTAGGGG